MMGRQIEVIVRTIRTRGRLFFGLVLVALGLAVSYPVAELTSAAPQGGTTMTTIYLPVATYLPHVYFPDVTKQLHRSLNLANGSFEADTIIDLNKLPANPCSYTGFTDYPKGNQHPSGWTFYSPAQGQTMPFPTKMQQGSVVPAISGGPGEYVHKCWWQLPENERLGQPRGLILAGDWVYKAFNSGEPQALELSQVVSGPPGHRMEVTGYILGETTNKPCSTCSKLEDDHFIGSVQLGGTTDTRFYVTMIQHYDVAGNQRNWNKYDVVATIPDSGQLTLTVIMQQNWAGETDFFIDNFQAVDLDD
jgi:hypothetical protein